MSKQQRRLSDIRAVITGGTSGLGLATAEKITVAGGKVCLLAIDDGQRQEGIETLGNAATYIQTDVTDEGAVDAAFAQAVEAMQHVNLVVNCAGIAPSQRVLGRDDLMSTAEFMRIVNINLTGTFSVCRAAANVMQHNVPDEQDQRGVIVNTASIAAQEGQIGQTAYAASKGGIISMALPLAREFARIGVRVMSIAPGLFQTPMFDTLPEKAVEALAASTPFPKRLGKPAEFAACVCHIYQNTMLNAEVIRLDGALRM